MIVCFVCVRDCVCLSVYGRFGGCAAAAAATRTATVSKMMTGVGLFDFVCV